MHPVDEALIFHAGSAVIAEEHGLHEVAASEREHVERLKRLRAVMGLPGEVS